MGLAESQRPRDVSARRIGIESAAVGICVAVLLLATSPGLPMAWDEGNAINRAEGIRRWAEGPDRFSRAAIDEHWRYTTVLEGHPAFYGIVIALGRAAVPGWFEPLTGFRLGPILLFSLAAGAMFYRLRRDESPAAAVCAVTALVLLPRMFAHAHFASIDGPLVSCWVLAWATFAAARSGWRWAILWGVTLGMTMSAKATGWIAPLSFLVWAAAYRDRLGLKALAVGLPVALAVFVLLNPPLWHHPLGGTATFLHLNLHRGDQPGINISTWFLGRMYNLDYSLPWYNTLFWTAVTVPVGLLGLAAVGLVAALRRFRSHPAGMLVAANWAVLLAVRALPGTPPHDGVRLFLPSFAFLAVLAGLGAAAVIGWASPGATAGSSGSTASTVGSADRGTRRLRPVAAVALIYLGSATSLIWYSPQWLSYYNLFLGGLPGATAAGMEPTYYWDGLDRSVLRWLAENTAAGEKVHFAAGSWENLEWMRRWGKLEVEFRAAAPGRNRWYVLQCRPSAWQPEDRRLIAHGEPAFTKTIRSGGWGPWRLDVPLVHVYSFSQAIEARQRLLSEAAEEPAE
jgi:4-amino-4-deoxy-L-arabinose transferase-like glycosyltransferase